MNLIIFAWLVLKASLLSNSGTGNVPILHADLVAHGQASDRQFAEALTIGQVSPGPTGLWVVSLGFLLHGWSGALLALVGASLPPLLVLLIQKVYWRVRHHELVIGFLRGLSLAVVGLFVVVLVHLLDSTGRDFRTMLIAAGAVAAGTQRRIPVIAILAVAALLGYFYR